MNDNLHRPVLDARFAAWIASNSPAAVGYHLRCGLGLPGARSGVPRGRQPDWLAGAVAAVLRRCYVLGMRHPTLEDVEMVALSSLPKPDGSVGEARDPFAAEDPMELWEEAVASTARAVHAILCYGPASGTAGGEILRSGGVLEAMASGLRIRQRVDLLWRRPDGALEAVVLAEEPWAHGGPPPMQDDWRCVLAAAAVASLYGEEPDIHVIWTAEGMARVGHVPQWLRAERLDRVKNTLDAAQRFEGLRDADETVLYRLFPGEMDSYPPLPGEAA